MDSAITLPAVRTIQGGQAFYVAAAPFALIARIHDDGAALGRGATHAMSRRPSASARKIANYVLGAPYRLLPPVVVAIDGGLRFDPQEPGDGVRGCGRLLLESTARLSWIDGAARAEGIADALRQKPELALETIGMVVTVRPTAEVMALLGVTLNAAGSPRLRGHSGRAAVDEARAPTNLVSSDGAPSASGARSPRGCKDAQRQRWNPDETTRVR